MNNDVHIHKHTNTKYNRLKNVELCMVYAVVLLHLVSDRRYNPSVPLIYNAMKSLVQN